MKLLAKASRRLIGKDDGMETLEYAILSGLITAAVLVAVAAIGAWIAYRLGLLQETIGA